MAKNFDSLSEDNPVMAILGKAKEELESNTETAAAPQTSESPVAVPVSAAATVPAEEPVEPKKTLMNISIRETTKKQWKMFFLEHTLSKTQGIDTAVEYLMSEVNKNNIKLSKGGITK